MISGIVAAVQAGRYYNLEAAAASAVSAYLFSFGSMINVILVDTLQGQKRTHRMHYRERKHVSL